MSKSVAVERPSTYRVSLERLSTSRGVLRETVDVEELAVERPSTYRVSLERPSTSRSVI